MLPLNEEADKFKKPKTRGRQKKNSIEEIIGAWEGEPLVRLNQGTIEK